MENELRQALKDGKSVKVSIDLDYSEITSQRPSKFIVLVIVDGKPFPCKFKQ